MIDLIRRNLPFFLPYLLLLLVGAVLQVEFSQAELFLFVNTGYSSGGDFFFQYCTHLGDGLFYGVVILLLLFVRYQYALIAVLSFAVSSLIAQLLKRLVFADVVRPKVFFEKSGKVLHWVEGVQIHSHNSFPSGHATTAFSLSCLLSLLAGDKKWGFFWFCLAALAAYSRVYLGQHFPADIYAGSVIGAGTTILFYAWLEPKLSRKPILNRSLLSSFQNKLQA